MHYHLEIVMPQIDNIKAAVEKILAPFNEQPDEADEEASERYAFWDFWVIGGRAAGSKLQATLDPAKLEAFHAWCQEAKLTVSGLTCGKQELSPASQIPMVDAKWNEMFPSDRPVPCPLFKHSNDQYNSNDLLTGDVMRFDKVPPSLKSERVIIAGPDYKDEGIEAKWMITDDQYNGVNYMKTTWDGTFGHAVEMMRKHYETYRDEYREKLMPKADWLVVTVDYHS